MKRCIIVLLLLLAAFAGGFIPVTKSENFKIGVSYYNVYRQFISPENWLKWQPELTTQNASKIKIDSNKSGFVITTPSLMFGLQNTGLGYFIVSRTRDHTTYNYNVLLTPENTTNKTLGLITRKTNVFGWIKSFITNDVDQSSIAGLKKYMEDTRLYYGFLIKKERTPAKLIAVKKGTFVNSGLLRGGNTMLNQLNVFISKNNLNIVAHVQMQYVSIKKDSTQIMLGFPVDKKIIPANGFAFMTMPKGRILVGYFRDRYKNRDKLYDAMRQYMTDNYIRPLIQPFERFDNNKLPANDSEVVNMQLVIPYM